MCSWTEARTRRLLRDSRRGTPAIGEAIALGAACDYLTAIGMDRVHAYENELGGYLHDALK